MDILKDSYVGRILSKNKGIIIVLLLLLVFLSFISPVFLTSNNIISLLQQITNNMFIAGAMTLIIITGGIDLSVGAIVALSGTTTVGLIMRSGLPILSSILIGLAVGTAIGALNGLVITKFSLPPFIVTLATMNIARGIAYLYSGGSSVRITEDSFTGLGTYRIFDIFPIPIIYMIIFTIIFSIVLSQSKFGTYIYAIGGNREAARLSGINTTKIEFSVYTISGFMAAFAGIILAARMYSGQPSIGTGYEMDAIAASVLGGVSMAGGKGSISGTLLGAIVIGVVSNGLNLMGISSFWQLVVMGIIILVAVIVDSKKNFFQFKRRDKVKSTGGKTTNETIS